MAHHIDHEWDLAQSNGFTVRMLIGQARDANGHLTDGSFKGSARIVHGGHPMEANIEEGRLNGDELAFKVRWPSGAMGQYIGRFDGSGHLTGVTFDVAHPHSQATWFRV